MNVLVFRRLSVISQNSSTTSGLDISQFLWQSWWRFPSHVNQQNVQFTYAGASPINYFFSTASPRRTAGFRTLGLWDGVSPPCSLVRILLLAFSIQTLSHQIHPSYICVHLKIKEFSRRGWHSGYAPVRISPLLFLLLEAEKRFLLCDSPFVPVFVVPALCFSYLL